MTDPVLERHFRGHKSTVNGLCFSPCGQQLVSCSEDCSLLLWNFTQSARCYKFEGHTNAVTTVDYCPTRYLFASASKETVRLWVPTIRGNSTEFKAHINTVQSVHFSSDGSSLVTASNDKTIKLWRTSHHKFLASFTGHTNWVRCARISPDGKRIMSCADDKTIRIFDVSSGECVHIFHELKGCAIHGEWHPSGTCIAIGLSNGTVKVYNTQTNGLQQHYQLHDDALTQLSFHPTGNYLLTASIDSTMKVVDLLEGRPIYTLKGHSGPIKAVTFSKSGEYFASGGVDQQVFVWKTNFDEDEPNDNVTNSKRSSTNISDCSVSVSKHDHRNANGQAFKERANDDKENVREIADSTPPHLPFNITPATSGNDQMFKLLEDIANKVTLLGNTVTSFDDRLKKIEAKVMK